jgi:hypothetical protein
MLKNRRANKNKLLIASLSIEEAITGCVAKNLNKFDKEIDIVLLDDFLLNYEIHDELNDNDVVIRWYKGLKMLSNKTHEFLNRVYYIPDDYFKDYIKEDQVYAKREFEAYIKFAFNAFSNGSRRSTSDLNVGFLSLPQQWQKIQNNTGIAVPNYFLGPRRLNPLRSNSIIYSDIYNLYNWSMYNTSHYIDDIDCHSHVFCFEKPQGYPVFVFNLGEKSFIDSEYSIEEKLSKKIKDLARKITANMNHFISEILFFVNGKRIMFGCINNEIVRTAKNLYFEDFVCENLIGEHKRCLA